MSGALVQLVSKGAQDVYITSDEGASLFSMKYKRHTNFSQAPRLIKEVTTKDKHHYLLDRSPNRTESSCFN